MCDEVDDPIDIGDLGAVKNIKNYDTRENDYPYFSFGLE